MDTVLVGVNCHGSVILHRSGEIIICLRFLKVLFPVRIQDMVFMSWPLEASIRISPVLSCWLC